jgi:hypothetical protein
MVAPMNAMRVSPAQRQSSESGPKSMRPATGSGCVVTSSWYINTFYVRRAHR